MNRRYFGEKSGKSIFQMRWNYICAIFISLIIINCRWFSLNQLYSRNHYCELYMYISYILYINISLRNIYALHVHNIYNVKNLDHFIITIYSYICALSLSLSHHIAIPATFCEWLYLLLSNQVLCWNFCWSYI